MIGLIKAVFGALGAIFGWFRDRQLINAGRSEQALENAQETLDVIAKVAVPITDADRKRVWDRIQAKYGPKYGVPNDPRAGPK
tara:strand:+ start:8891 stop:9139 length:249 start_codon:yes stop_codon:yes gene_type:complete